MKNEMQALCAAITFYTRIPLPQTVIVEERAFYTASKYLPLIGWLVGCTQALMFVVLHLFFPIRVCVVLTVVAGILVTGALHEDGFIDCCDAFGGGKDKDETLRIMKDSHIGAYGLIGYSALLFLKIELFVVMAAWDSSLVILCCIAAQSLSRLMALWFIATEPYARLNDESSKSRMLVSAVFERREILWAVLCGLLPLLFLQSLWLFVIAVALLVLLKRSLSTYFVRRIGGYTGDCLGAVQQISEVMIYMSIVLIWNCI